MTMISLPPSPDDRYYICKLCNRSGFVRQLAPNEDGPTGDAIAYCMHCKKYLRPGELRRAASNGEALMHFGGSPLCDQAATAVKKATVDEAEPNVDLAEDNMRQTQSNMVTLTISKTEVNDIFSLFDSYKDDWAAENPNHPQVPLALKILFEHQIDKNSSGPYAITFECKDWDSVFWVAGFIARQLVARNVDDPRGPAIAKMANAIDELCGETIRNELKRESPESKEASESCFIATACYGSASHENVIFLRKFRDQILIEKHYGRLFLKQYYRFSPFFARRIQSNKTAKFIVRGIIIIPIVFVLKSYHKALKNNTIT